MNRYIGITIYIILLALVWLFVDVPELPKPKAYDVGQYSQKLSQKEGI